VAACRRHRRQDDRHVDLRAVLRVEQHVGVGRRMHAAVDVRGPVDMHRSEHTGDRARRRDRVAHARRHVTAEQDALRVARPHRGDQQRLLGPVAEEIVDFPQRTGPVERPKLSDAIAIPAAEREALRHRSRARQPEAHLSHPVDRDPQVLASGSGDVRDDQAVRSSGQSRAEHRSDDAARRRADDHVGRSWVESEVVVQCEERPGVKRDPRHPTPTEHEPDPRRCLLVVRSIHRPPLPDPAPPHPVPVTKPGRQSRRTETGTGLSCG
jgi:hypothetical protein